MNYFNDFATPYVHLFDISNKAHATNAKAAREAAKTDSGSVQARGGSFYAVVPGTLTTMVEAGAAATALLASGEEVTLPAGHKVAYRRGFEVQQALEAYPDRIFHHVLCGTHSLYFDSTFGSPRNPLVEQVATQLRTHSNQLFALRMGRSGYLRNMLANSDGGYSAIR